jgi:opacity protein-like surface antigen
MTNLFFRRVRTVLIRTPTVPLALAAMASMLLVAPAVAQTTVLVTSDQATMWRPGFGSVVTVVKKGTELEVVAREGDWYEVVLPFDPRRTATGMVSVRQVTPLKGLDQTPPRRVPRAQRAQRQRPIAPRLGVRGFGNVGGNWFTARKSFDAVMGQSFGAFFGGGGEVRLRDRLFVQGAIERFQRTGERVFVFADQVFKLGIPDTVTLTPVTVTGGYRFPRRDYVPYVGGGIGTYSFSEKSSFEDPTEAVDERFTSYHVLGGVEWRGNRWISAAVEGQYTHVPDALQGGVATAFREHNLGGVGVRLRVFIGR